MAGALLALPPPPKPCPSRFSRGHLSPPTCRGNSAPSRQVRPKASAGQLEAFSESPGGALPPAAEPQPAPAGPAVWVGQLLQGYNSALEAHPVATKALTSLVGFALGDVLAQGMTAAPFDPARCLRLSTYGLLFDGPGGHAWYKLLDDRILPQDPKSNLAVAIKTAADQVVWAPVMTVVFFAVLKLLEGHPDQIVPTIQDKLMRTLMANYLIWPLVHWINFKLVPPQYRVLYNNAIAIVWNAWISWYCSSDCTTAASNGVDQASPQPVVPSLPCQQHRSLPFESGLAAAARETAAVERLLASWGLQGLPNSAAGGELLQHYFSQKGDVIEKLCGFPLHSTPPKF